MAQYAMAYSLVFTNQFKYLSSNYSLAISFRVFRCASISSSDDHDSLTHSLTHRLEIDSPIPPKVSSLRLRLNKLDRLNRLIRPPLIRPQIRPIRPSIQPSIRPIRPPIRLIRPSIIPFIR